MARMIFVNLAVQDVVKSTAFYEAVGAVRNPQFSDDTGSCMVLSETIHVMILSHEKFMQFSPRPIADARKVAQALFCISAESRADVDATIEAARKSGGTPDPSPEQDHGFMYGRSFEDPDGHLWEVMWMDMAAMQSATASTSATSA